MLKVQFLSKKYTFYICTIQPKLICRKFLIFGRKMDFSQSVNQIKYFLLIFQFLHKALKSKVPSNLSLAVVAILSAVRFGVLTLPLV